MCRRKRTHDCQLSERRCSLLQGRRLLPPSLELIVSPIGEIIHVFQKLFPGHHTWRWVRRYEALALRAAWVRTKFLAHLFAETRKLVLQLRATLQIGCLACFLPSFLPNMEHGRHSRRRVQEHEKRECR